MTLNKFN